jgi:hypothetical protein
VSRTARTTRPPTRAGAGWVRIGSTLHTLDSLREAPERHTRAFEEARRDVGHAQCLCSGASLRLVIRLRAGRYHLAGWPDEGALHDPTCSFYKLADELSGQAAYSRDAITETPDGVRITLREPLLLQGQHTAPQAEFGVNPEPTTRNCVTLLGLLHWMWEHAGLNVWHRHAGPRTWTEAHHRLVQATENCTTNHLPLEEVLYIVPPFTRPTAQTNAASRRRWAATLGSRPEGTRRGLLLGEIRQVQQTEHGYRIALRHTATPVFAKAQVLHRAQNSHRAAFATNLPTGARQVVLVLAERTLHGNLRALEIAAMLANRVLIPADSSHEVTAADRLVRAGRDFAKPCRYDNNDTLFPDFVLTDVAGPDGPSLAFIEVWGITGREAYDRRRQRKETLYRVKGNHLVGWDVSQGPFSAVPLPPRHPR